MTKEQAFFLQTLSDYLNGRKTGIADNLDWDEILHYSRKHQVGGFLYVQTKDSLPKTIKNTFQQEALKTFYHTTNIDNEVQLLKGKADEAGISFFIVKGPSVAELYPHSKLRSMGDIDLVVHSADREIFHDIFLDCGYTSISKQADREWQYLKRNIEIELHDRLVYEEVVNRNGQDEFFNNCWKYVSNGKLNWNFHLLFLIFHLRKHFMNAGVGFRQFMDLAVVAQKTHIDWEWLEEYLSFTGMYEFAQKCYGFIERWFDVNAPLSIDIEDDFFEEATQKIFADGVFGFDNTDNNDSGIINKIKDEKHPKIMMRKIFLKRIFPSQKEMGENGRFTYVKKNRLLLPLAWIHRMIVLYKQRGIKNMKREIKKHIVTDARIKQRKTMLEKWGL